MRFICFLAAALSVAFCFSGSSSASTPIRLANGSFGPAVTTLQQYLHMNKRQDFYKSNIDGDFGPITKTGLAGWQKAAGFRPSGWVVLGGRQWNRLRLEATVYRLPPGIDPRAVAGAKRNGWSVDASKRTNMLYMLRSAGGHVTVALSTPTSFGGCNSDGCFVTPDGAFSVCRKAGPNEISHEWKDAQGNWAPMPWAVYLYIGGRCSGTAVHQDPLGNSHECVHVPDMGQAQYINQHIPYGALVVIHG